ncbi:MAG: hypothetical protein PUD93_07480 [Lachnospiraceae bacterium]|nr:hypothetical protein [Lachnospiraceae bacterium]
MKIQSNAKLNIIAKNERQATDGKSYYNVAVLLEGQAGNLSCTEDVYNDAVVGVENDVILEYNSEYKSLRLIAVHPFGSGTAGKPTEKPTK